MKKFELNSRDRRKEYLRHYLGIATKKNRQDLIDSPESQEVLKDNWENSHLNSNKDIPFHKESVLQEILASINNKNEQGGRIVVISFMRKYAAILIFGLIVGLGGIYFGFFSEPLKLNTELLEISSLENETKDILLSDGTKVILNAGSSLKYPKEFSRKNRSVSISGEAYFEVAHIDSKPFIVNTSGVVIEVLGTTFEVRAYPGNGCIETTLLQGKVKISRLNPKTRKTQSVILTPNHKATFFIDDERFIMDKINISQVVSWTKNSLVIDNETLEAVLQKIELRYSVKTSLTDDSLGKLRISMKIDDEPLDQILTIIKKTLPVATSDTNGVIVFSPLN